MSLLEVSPSSMECGHPNVMDYTLGMKSTKKLYPDSTTHVQGHISTIQDTEAQ
jgi:hypothetical protein